MEGGISKVLRGQGVGRRTKKDSLATRLWIIQKHTLEVMEEKWAFDTGAPEGAIQMVPVMLKMRRREKGIITGFILTKYFLHSSFPLPFRA